MSMNGHSQNQFLMQGNGLGMNPNTGLAQGINAANAGCGSCGGACQCANNQATLSTAGLSMNSLGADQFQNNGLGLSGVMGQGFANQGVGGANMGVAGSTLNLMAQITSMMATIMTGLMSLITQLLSGSGGGSADMNSLASVNGGGSSLQDLVDLSGTLPRNRTEETTSNTEESQNHDGHDHGDHAGHDHGDVRSLEEVDLPAGTRPAEANLVLPLDRQHVDKPSESGDFGPRVPPVAGASSYHQGSDFGAATGTPIYAAQGGTVELLQPASLGGGAGNYVIIDHGNGLKTRYLHMHDFADGLKVGDTVEAGQTIGGVGATGIGSGPHLHFEVIVNDEKVDPWPYLKRALA